VAGDIQHGETVQISGSAFGATGRELPILFDDFESGQLGENLNTGKWQTDSGNGSEDPVFDDSYAYGGSQSGHGDMHDGGDSAAFIRGVNSHQVYVSLMFRYQVTRGEPVTSKGVRVHADDGPNVYTSYPGMFVQDYYSRNRNTIAYKDGSGTVSDYSPGDLEQNQWMRKEYYLQMSYPAGSSNGVVKSWIDTELDSNWGGVSREAGVSDVYQLVMMPFYFGNGGGGRVWYDDVYISKSQARVELCNSASWSNCSGRSIQVPTSWGNSVIEATLNLSGISLSGDLYLYVIDDEGVVSDAHLVGSNTEAAPVPPRAPHGLSAEIDS